MTCEHKKEDNTIRDRIVFGMRDAETKNKLLSMDNPTLNKAEMLCRTREVTDKEIQEMTTETATVHYMSQEQNNWIKSKNDKIKNKHNNKKFVNKEHKVYK